ncbi:hypothetical protein BaRGS_00030825 [Batillaria attramentaria]|uniref:Uncharacterized protein n=1 Tax=Batillaria attramentaria TaxID=370345 RepID=A0ABD0JT13_9CAEN
MTSPDTERKCRLVSETSVSNIQVILVVACAPTLLPSPGLAADKQEQVIGAVTGIGPCQMERHGTDHG